MDTDHCSGSSRVLRSRVKTRLQRPPEPSPIDRLIDLHHGSTTATEATPQRLQESKQDRVPSLPERIEQLQKQNSSLRHEVAYYRQMEQYRGEFEEEVMQLKGNLEKALFKLGGIQRQIDYDWSRVKQDKETDGQSGSSFESLIN